MSMQNRFRAFAPYLAPLFLGVSFFAAARAPLAVRPEWRVMILGAIFLVVIIATAGSTLFAAQSTGMSQRRSLQSMLTPTLFVASAFGLFLLVEHDLSRYAVAVLAMGLLSAYFAYVIGIGGVFARYSADDLGHLLFALRMITSFFCFAFAFGVSSFTVLPQPLIGVAMGALVALFTWETFWNEGFTGRHFLMIVLAFGVLGVELYAALSLLPIDWSVDAAVALILFVSALHAAMRILKGLSLSRQQFVFTFSLTLLVLGTARWT